MTQSKTSKEILEIMGARGDLIVSSLETKWKNECMSYKMYFWIT